MCLGQQRAWPAVGARSPSPGRAALAWEADTIAAIHNTCLSNTGKSLWSIKGWPGAFGRLGRQLYARLALFSSSSREFFCLLLSFEGPGGRAGSMHTMHQLLPRRYFAQNVHPLVEWLRRLAHGEFFVMK